METTTLSHRLQKEYKKIFATRSRIERINQEQKVYLPNKDLDAFYDGMFLKSVTLFESFVEELFIGLLYNKYKFNTNKRVQKYIFPDRKLALNYVLNGKNFIDLLPYEKLAKISKIHFKEKNPFIMLDKNSKILVEETYIIRNAIAHSSLIANERFNKFLNDKHNTLPSNQRTPSKFLQSLHTSSQTMFEIYIIELNSLAHQIASYN